VGAEILKKLQKQFKDSSRVECLRGMACESIGNLDEAEMIYDKILASKPTFPDAFKRKVCLRCSQIDSNSWCKTNTATVQPVTNAVEQCAYD
jgi:hypothetical protein